jgi:hypothetical protein
VSVPTPAETRESCRRLLDPPKLRPTCHYCRARAAEPGQVAAFAAGWDTRPGPAGVAWWRCPACRAEDGAEAALSIPVRVEPGLWGRLREAAADGYLLWTVLGLRCVIWAIWRR